MKKVYVGSMQGSFKQRYYNHKSSFAREIYRHKTSLSNYVWEVKKQFGIDLTLKWGIVKRCSKYKGGGDRYCKLCMEEKLFYKPKELLNQRSGIWIFADIGKIG